VTMLRATTTTSTIKRSLRRRRRSFCVRVYVCVCVRLCLCDLVCVVCCVCDLFLLLQAELRVLKTELAASDKRRSAAVNPTHIQRAHEHTRTGSWSESVGVNPKRGCPNFHRISFGC